MNLNSISYHLSAPYLSSYENLLENDFYSKIYQQVRELNLLIKDFDSNCYSNPLIEKGRLFILKHKIKKIISFLLDNAPFAPSDLKVKQTLNDLAYDLKRNSSNRSLIWEILSPSTQKFLHQKFSWTEELTSLKKEPHFHWLGHRNIKLIRQDEALADFGTGHLFKVKPLSDQNESTYDFALINHPGFKVSVYLSEQKQKTPVSFFTPHQTLNQAAIGRLQEVFNVASIEQKLKDDPENQVLYHNQLSGVFSCYRSALCSLLDVPTYLPLAIARQGEWTIWPDKPKKSLAEMTLSSAVLADTHRLFSFEKLWKINIFSHSTASLSAILAVCDEQVFIDAVLPLPYFTRHHIKASHDYLKNQLKLEGEVQQQWESLESVSEKETIKLSLQLKIMKLLLDQNKINSEDLLNFNDQLLFIVALIQAIDTENLNAIFSLSSSFLPVAQQLLTGLFPTADSIPYQVEQTSKHQGLNLTNQILNARKKLRDFILLSFVEQFEKKTSFQEMTENLSDVAKEKCQEIEEELVSTLETGEITKEEIENYFNFSFAQEFFNELEGIFKKTSTYHEILHQQLLLLRAAFEYDLEKIEKINGALQSILHEAMVKKYSQKFLDQIQ